MNSHAWSCVHCYELLISSKWIGDQGYEIPLSSMITGTITPSWMISWPLQCYTIPLGAAAISVFILNHSSLRSPMFMLKLKFGVQCYIFSCLPVQLYLGEIVWSCAAQINGRRSNKQVDFKFPLETREYITTYQTKTDRAVLGYSGAPKNWRFCKDLALAVTMNIQWSVLLFTLILLNPVYR